MGLGLVSILKHLMMKDITLKVDSKHTPEFFGLLIKKLELAGYDAMCPHLPTCSASANPNMDMYADAKVVEDVARVLVEKEHKRVLVVVHSYGGTVGTQGIPQELGRQQRQQMTKPGGIVGVGPDTLTIHSLRFARYILC